MLVRPLSGGCSGNFWMARVARVPLNRWGGCRPPPYPQAASMPCLSCSTLRGGRSMKDMIIGVDLAKRIFQVHGATLLIFISD